MSRIFFDNASTTRPSDDILEAVRQVSGQYYGNPSSTHRAGSEARKALDDAREMIAAAVGTNPKRVIFTGTASEANNMVVKTIAHTPSIMRIATTKIEHHSIIEAVAQYCPDRVEYIPVDVNGIPDINRVLDLAGPSTALVFTLVNNELGTILPVDEIAEIAAQKGGVLFLDCVQAVGKIDLSSAIRADYVTISSHKIHGPKGAAAVIAKDRQSLRPLILGGPQEFGKRAGTENVPACYGFALACKRHIEGMSGNIETFRALRNEFLKGLACLGIEHHLNSSFEHSVPNIVNVSFPSVDSEYLQLALDQEGICVSGGSACSSQSISMSHVIASLPIEERYKRSAVRFSFSIYNTTDEVRSCLKALRGICDRFD